MNLKRISISVLLVLLITLTLTSVSAADNTSEITAGSEITVSGTNTSDIQNAIDTAQSGDVINLGSNKAYNIGDDQITISKNITLKGDNVNISAGYRSGAIDISSNAATISGITFLNTNTLPDYGGTITGIAINTRGSSNLVITDCKFINYADGIYFSSTKDSIVKNCYFTGTTTSVLTKESGTKAVNVMGSKNIQFINNTFYGQVLDGLSIASGSGNILVENNTFINNTYAIYYGGASTSGSIIRNNKFITCGSINTTGYSTNLKQTFEVNYQNLPFISLQKSSDDIEITGNTFTVKDNNIVILSEAENTAHGFPSTIGSINITNNIIKLKNSNVDATTVTLYYLKVLQSLSLTPTGDIVVKDNDFTNATGVENFHLEFSAIETGENSITIPKAYTDTYLTVNYVKDGRVIIKLCDINGEEVIGEKITYSVNGVSSTGTTDIYGQIYLEDLSGDVKITADYAGSDSYYSSSLSATVSISTTQTQTSIKASALSVNAVSAKSTTYKFTLKDASGNVLSGKSVSITFNGKIYALTSDSNGVVSFKINTATAGKYAVTMAFSGDSAYKGSVALSTITIQKQATKLTVAKKTFKKSATKKVTAVLKDNTGKVIKSKKVTLKVNGKTYKATTNAKGVATFTLKLTKKGTFTATTKFAGDTYYKAKTVTSKIVVK